MTQATFVSTLNGLLPMDDAAQGVIRRAGMGEVVNADFKVMRNGKFFRKWWALVNVAFGIWEETKDPVYHHGDEVLPNFDEFRKNVTILTGHREAVVTTRNEVVWRAKSIAWSNMSEDEFEGFYSKTIDVILRRVLKAGAVSRSRLEEMVLQVLRFD